MVLEAELIFIEAYCLTLTAEVNASVVVADEAAIRSEMESLMAVVSLCQCIKYSCENVDDFEIGDWEKTDVCF